MKAYLSYSLNDRDLYIITLLSNQLRNEGNYVVTGNNLAIDSMDTASYAQLLTCHFFIGLISFNGQQINRVQYEWQNAVTNKIPAILLIEEGLPLSPAFNGEFIRFNRLQPSGAINEIRNRINAVTMQRQVNTQPQSNNNLGWILGGAALIAILALLSNSDNK